MHSAEFERIAPLEHSDYRTVIAPVSEAVWPEFMHHDPVATEHWDGLYELFPSFQFALQSRTGAPAAIVNSVPLAWDGSAEGLPDEGWDWALIQSVEDYARRKPPKTLCGIQISIHPDFQGRGLSTVLLQMLRELADEQGFSRVIVPVRPTLKARYPLLPMASYIRWQNELDEPFDPWLRVHVRAGGRIVSVCERAFHAIGTVSEWAGWTGLSFQDSGEYVVPGALCPVRFDLDADRGLYVEPNVWLLHDLAEPR